MERWNDAYVLRDVVNAELPPPTLGPQMDATLLQRRPSSAEVWQDDRESAILLGVRVRVVPLRMPNPLSWVRVHLGQSPETMLPQVLPGLAHRLR